MRSDFSGCAPSSTHVQQTESPLVSPIDAYATRAEAVAELLVLTHTPQHLLLPGGRKLLRALVVASQTVNTALDQNQAELGVAVLSVALEVLSHGHSLLDQEVHVLRERGGQS